jgi:hypothetical protein
VEASPPLQLCSVYRSLAAFAEDFEKVDVPSAEILVNTWAKIGQPSAAESEWTWAAQDLLVGHVAAITCLPSRSTRPLTFKFRGYFGSCVLWKGNRLRVKSGARGLVQ